MKSSTLKLQIYLPPTTRHKTNSPPLFSPFKLLQPFPVLGSRVTRIISRQILGSPRKPSCSVIEKREVILAAPEWEETAKREHSHDQVSSSGDYSRFVIAGAVSIGLALLLMGADEQKAMALGPEGPLMEEFWDNVRRYALYALTVSTGAIYTIFLPILELLKNPISAVLILLIIGGSIYIVSQVLSAMVGVSDFTYSYGY